MKTTEKLNSLNNSRKLIPSKYVWGQFTPDFEGKGYTELPEQTVIDNNDTFAVYSQNGEQIIQLSLTNLKNVLTRFIQETVEKNIFYPGIILPFSGTTPPPTWLICSGQAVSRVEFENLFNVIGVTFGSGDGSTTFNVPDLRGRFIKGKEDSESVGQINEAGLPNITGQFNAGGVWTRYAQGAFLLPTGEVGGGGPSGEGSFQTRYRFDASNSSPIYGNSNTVTPKNTALNYIIKT